MIEAQIRGKLPEVANSEDCLTSTVFGLLKYSSMRQILWEFIGSASRHTDDRTCLAGYLQAFSSDDDGLEVRFWERHGDFGAPDILLVGKKFALVVEVKYGAELSGEDQLRKYHALLGARFPDRSHRQVIYLTADLTPPVLTPEQTRGIESDLWWLSWYQLSEVLSRRAGADSATDEMSGDLMRFLCHRGLALFQGITIPQVSIHEPIFWDGTSPLITQYDAWPSGRKIFWKEDPR